VVGRKEELQNIEVAPALRLLVSLWFSDRIPILAHLANAALVGYRKHAEHSFQGHHIQHSAKERKKKGRSELKKKKCCVALLLYY
jgi:hypothetical protein